MMRQDILEDLSEDLYTAWMEKKAIPPFTHDYPEISEEEAYIVQQAMVRRLVQAGYHISGRKLGYTNPVMQEQMKLAGPSYGMLLAELCYDSDAELKAADFIQPGIETEILFTLNRDLKGREFSREEVIDAVDHINAAIEVVDMRQQRIRKTQRDSIGDEGAFGAYVIGTKAAYVDLELAELESVLLCNGREIARGDGRNVMRDPLNSLLWAVNRLSGTEDWLRAGEAVMTGSYTALAPAKAGDSFTAAFGGWGTVTVHFR